MNTIFETSKTYIARSICDNDCVFSFTIIKRTAKTVWVKVHGEIVSRRVSEDYDGAECFYPFGKYSMAACINANKMAA